MKAKERVIERERERERERKRERRRERRKPSAVLPHGCPGMGAGRRPSEHDPVAGEFRWGRSLTLPVMPRAAGAICCHTATPARAQTLTPSLLLSGISGTSLAQAWHSPARANHDPLPHLKLQGPAFTEIQNTHIPSQYIHNGMR